MSKKVTDLIRIEGARIILRDFSGKKFGESNRTFGVLLDDDKANILKEDGWGIKYLRPREDDPTQYSQPWLKVKVSYKAYEPEIWVITERGKKMLNEVTVGQLDWARIKDCDVVISPYNYPAMAGHPAGVSAYVKSMFVTIDEDPFDIKYSDVPIIGENESNEETDSEEE